MTVDHKFRSFEKALIEQRDLSDVDQFVACLLLQATSARPIGIHQIQSEVAARFLVHGDIRPTPMILSDREIKALIRRLRQEQAFPILSRKGKPSGYWWCTSTGEMVEFIDQWSAQARDEFATLSKIVNANYPELAGQLRLEVD